MIYMRYGYSDHPYDKEAMQQTRADLLARRKILSKGSDWEWMFLRAEGKTVLDIGSVGHTFENTQHPNWHFGRLRKISRHVVGVDILEKECEELKKIGHDVRAVDATSEIDLGERFDLIIIGDVIEHVNDPVALLRFCRRHLQDHGRVLVSTPNPHHVGKWKSALCNGTIVDNLEHVSWISPFQAQEIGRRADLFLISYQSFINRVRIWRAWLLKRPVSDCYTRNFVFEFSLPSHYEKQRGQ
jgi:2-polyprenyl-3-methyl-5-hydroxy-6-metoxy-1,4-benzoquinol methylase